MLVDRDTVTERYARAETFLQRVFSLKTTPNSILFPKWIGETDTFWYERYSKNGREYRLVDARENTNTEAFDHGNLAFLLAEISGEDVDPNNLPITQVRLQIEPFRVSFRAFDKSWIYKCEVAALEQLSVSTETGLVSPDSAYAVFRKEHDLWLRDIESGEEKPLTFDGEEHFCYGAVGLAWAHPTTDTTKLQAVWSPDSKKILTVQRDSRRVKTLPVLHNLPKDGGIRPTVKNVKVAYPGDEHVEDYRVLAIDVSTGEITEAAHERTPTIRNSGGFFSDNLGWWNDDSKIAYFVHVDRYYKCARLIEFDVTSGATETLFEEKTRTQLQLSDNADESPNVLPMPGTDELIWYSCRSGWAHLYLYNTKNGELKRSITSGEWTVRDIVHYDPKNRDLYLQTSSRQKPCHRNHKDLIKVNIDSAEIRELASPEYTNYAAREGSFPTILATSFGAETGSANAISPSGNFFVVTRSRLDKAPVSILCDAGGREIMQLETADLTDLPDNWRWPESIKTVADDGETEIHGCLYRPSTFSENETYPVLNQVFNSPELPWMPEGSFACDGMFGFSYYVGAALAELGFIVVQFAGRGTTGRSKEFLDASYGWAEDSSNLSDHVAGIKQLAETRPYMDLDRVGIISDQGGPGGVQGLLDYPDFYKVGVTSTIHDSRLMSATMWGDKFEGPIRSEGRVFPEEKADQLRGKLLITHSMLDTTTPPASAFRVIEALKKANKNFDMLFMPCQGHDISNYVTRRSWDYLVTHLLGEEPPHEYPLKGYHWTD